MEAQHLVGCGCSHSRPRGFASLSALYRPLTIDDRIEINKLLDEVHSRAEIARRRGSLAGRCAEGRGNPRLIMRTFARICGTSCTVVVVFGRPGATGLHARYQVASAIPNDARSELHWTVSMLRDGWTSEDISGTSPGRLPIDLPDDTAMRVSVETLYSWVYDPAQKHRQLGTYLTRGYEKRVKHGGRRTHFERIKHRVRSMTGPRRLTTASSSGAEHPKVASAITAQTGSIRRWSDALANCSGDDPVDRRAADGRRTTERVLRLPTHAVRSITADNGSDFAFRRALGSKTSHRPSSPRSTTHPAKSSAGHLSRDRPRAMLRIDHPIVALRTRPQVASANSYALVSWTLSN